MAEKILLCRTDRIGDLLLTTPAVSGIRRAKPDAHIGFLASAYAAPILKNNPDIDEIINDNGSVWELAKLLRKKKFDKALIFFLNSRIALTGFLAGIPERIGPASKPSAVLLTRRIFQHRSRAQKHEAQYNIDLAEALGAKNIRYPLKLILDDADVYKAKEFFNRNKLKNVVGIHPGGKGSAAAWPKEKFADLSRGLIEQGLTILLSFGPREEELAKYFKGIFNEKHFVPGNLSLREFAGFISKMRMFVSNSTGPLHIAVSLKIPTVSFFPKINVQSSKRWGPWGNGHIVLEPVDRISVSQAMEAILMKGHSRPSGNMPGQGMS